MTDHELDDAGRKEPEPIAEAIVVHPDAGYEMVLRKSFRIPQDQEYPLRVTIPGMDTDVLNSSDSGLQLLLDQNGLLQVNQVVEHLELAFMDQAISVRGTVVHISPMETDRLGCGMKLDFPDEGGRQKFQKYQEFIRARLLQRQQAYAKNGSS